MKTFKRYLALVLGISMLATACSGPAKTEDENNGETSVSVDVEKEARQAKLDVIEPSAYGNVDGLNLEEGTYISVIGKSTGSEFWKEVKAGAMQAGADINSQLGYKGEEKVKVVYSGPANEEDVDGQVNILDEELARYPAAVAIAITDVKACDVQFDLAMENNIPVVAFDSGSNYQGLEAMVASDNKKASKEAADKIAELVGDEGEIILFSHDSDSETGVVREEVFKKRLKKHHPDVKVATTFHLDHQKKYAEKLIKAVEDGKYDIELPLTEEGQPDVNAITMDMILDYIAFKYPDAKGLYATNAETMNLAATYCKKHDIDKDSFAVVGFDVNAQGLQDLQDGIIDELIVQNPFGMGYAAVVAASRASLGMGNEAVVDTGYVFVNKDNLNDADIQKFLY